jgi:hypothetical protein
LQDVFALLWMFQGGQSWREGGRWRWDSEKRLPSKVSHDCAITGDAHGPSVIDTITDDTDAGLETFHQLESSRVVSV